MIQLGKAASCVVERAITKQLIHWFPLLSVYRSTDKVTVLVNLHDFALASDGNTFVDLLCLCEKQSPSTQAACVGSLPQQEQSVVTRPNRKPGRRVICDEYPEVVIHAMEFIKLHGFGAQARRRSSEANSNGVTLEQIRTHLLTCIPGLKSLSRTTVHQLMVPPRKGSHNARRYRGHLDVRVPQKRNNVHISHPDSNYCRAQMAYMLEFGQKFSRSVATLSCDNKMKVNVGTLAVSSYHQLKHFFSSGRCS